MNVPLVSSLQDKRMENDINTSIKAADRFIEGYEADETKQMYMTEKYSGPPQDFRPDHRVSNTYYVGSSGTVSMIVGCTDGNGIYTSCPANVTCVIYSVKSSGEPYCCCAYYVTDCWHGMDGVCCDNITYHNETSNNVCCSYCTYRMRCYYYLGRWCEGFWQRNHYCVFEFDVKSGVSCIDMSDSAVNIFQKIMC